ncbi:hypothetical protein TRFO_17411 [Tritrichomonas foetus]|uniref:TPR Domain containing protein n=1 Tax=Tritrichomonas foetus TaxID=1144522 RepID=A0A1J4KMZ4_9EUKA|nr:hypothetical protein TRFO_17411 [Tritrichomonas foetus]|eukprot:OHT12695.1 hypothetical protein TRFO_17411 [Tritrichomonas foetus]
MALRSLEPENEQTARILLRQGRSDSACRILESSMATKAKTYGSDSIEFQEASIENIESLLQNVVMLVESKKYDAAVVPLNKILSWTSPGENSLPIQEPNKSQYRAIAFFLNGCVEKGKNNYESSLQYYMNAAPFFESCGMVSELVASYIGASHTLMALDRDDEALIHLRTAYDLLSSPDVSPNVANPVHEAMAYIYMKKGQFEKAKESLEMAIKTRTLTEFLPKFRIEQSRCSSANSTHSAGSGPKPPSATSGGARFRANMARQKRGSNSSVKKEIGHLPIKELGQLKISVNRLMSCV